MAMPNMFGQKNQTSMGLEVILSAAVAERKAESVQAEVLAVASSAFLEE